MESKLAHFLTRKADEYNTAAFIKTDPISIPHRFSLKQDIEISGFFAALFAWGNRTIIINKAGELLQRMDNAPFDFVKNCSEQDAVKLFGFKHRTFNETDLLYFIHFLRHHYSQHSSLEEAFLKAGPNVSSLWAEEALNSFYHYFFSFTPVPDRTRKHIAAPFKNSTCKRLNMFLRWMVRKDNRGVDFGLWKKINPADLICPVDVHVARVAKRFGLLQRKPVDWPAAVELTGRLKVLDPSDPARYDFALFGLGVAEKY